MESSELQYEHGGESAQREAERAITEIETLLAGYESLDENEVYKKFQQVEALIRGLSEEARDNLADNDDVVGLLGRVHLKSLPTLH